MRRGLVVVRVLLALVLVGVSGLLVTSQASAAPYCGIRWGSLAKQAVPTSTAPLVNVRAGQHACYDRLVLDFATRADGYRVEYFPEFADDATGFVVPIRGGAKLMVVVDGRDFDMDTGALTFVPANRMELVQVNGFRTFRQVAGGTSFEGTLTVGLGVRARLPFRVFTLGGPGARSRIVIDVAHRW